MRTSATGIRAGVVGALAMVLAAAPGLAGDFDGSKLLICAPVEVLDCAAGVACEKTTPHEVGLPAFFRIDFARNALVGPNRTTPIELKQTTDAQILLRGTELGYAWTVALDVATGRIATTLVNREEVFVLFGACTPP
jgi:hypothetical protein